MVPDDATTSEKIIRKGDYEIFIPDSSGFNVALAHTVKIIE